MNEDAVRCATEMARSWRKWAVQGGIPPSAVKTATTIEALLAEHRRVKADAANWRRQALEENAALDAIRSEV